MKKTLVQLENTPHFVMGFALHAVALVDDGDICKALLAAGADPYKVDEKFGQTALHVAAIRFGSV